MIFELSHTCGAEALRPAFTEAPAHTKLYAGGATRRQVHRHSANRT
jgi:hypothetical protein